MQRNTVLSNSALQQENTLINVKIQVTHTFYISVSWPCISRSLQYLIPIDPNSFIVLILLVSIVIVTTAMDYSEGLIGRLTIATARQLLGNSPWREQLYSSWLLAASVRSRFRLKETATTNLVIFTGRYCKSLTVFCLYSFVEFTLFFVDVALDESTANLLQKIMLWLKAVRQVVIELTSQASTVGVLSYLKLHVFKPRSTQKV